MIVRLYRNWRALRDFVHHLLDTDRLRASYPLPLRLDYLRTNDAAFEAKPYGLKFGKRLFPQ